MLPWEQNWSGQPASSEAAPWERQWGGAPVAKPEEDGDFIRGGKEAFQQLPQMGYGLIAGAGAIGEKVFGEGGIATGVKQAGLKGYTEWADKMAAQSKPSDSWSYSYAKAKDGDFGALVDWLQHGIGYAGAQGVQMLATAGIGAAGGKLLIGAAAGKLASGMVAKEAARLAAENATVEATKRIAADQISSLAVKNVASKLGQLGAVGALATGQEGGEIFGGLVQKAEEEGTQLSGGDLARAFGATLAAGGLEFVGDKLGLDVLLGRSKLVNPAKAMTGLGGRAARGVLAGAAVAPAEAATEYFQTGIEEYGKGTETNPLPWLQSPENQAQAFDAAALGGLGGAMVGGAGGAVHGAQTGKREEPVANIEDIATAPSIDEAIIAADKAVSGEPTRGERVANIKSELSDRAIVGDLRTKYGDDGFSQLLTSLNQANNPRTPEATREKHLQAVETALFNLRVSVDQPTQTPLLEGQQAMPMLTGPDGLPLLGNVSTPTGTMRAGPDGVAVPETAADLTETMRARDERTSLGEQQGQMPDDVIPMGMRQEQPAWTNPRSKAPEPTIIDALNVPNAVNAYVDRQRAINTPMAHAFVQAFDSGRITPADVAKLIVPAQQETPNDRIAAAAATAPQTLQQRLEAFRRAPDATTIETPVVASRPRPKGAPDAIGGTSTVQDMAQGRPEQAGRPAAAPAPGSADALPVGVQSGPDAALSLRERADAMRAKNAPAVASAEQPAVAPEKPRVFKTRKNAIAERDRLGNEHKLQKIKGGFILRRKTDKEMAAEARAGRRFASGAASGLRRSLLATIAAGGGLNISERPDTIGEGNRNVGGRMVFTRAGKTINQWAETLAQSGFIPPGEVESDDGVRWLQDAIGEEFAGRREHFAMDDEARMEEAARASQGEEPAPDDDQFGPLSDFDLEELSADGYAAASPEVQALTEQVLAAADEAGIDIEALREDAARLTEGLSDDEYHAQLQASARAAIAQTRTDAARRDAGADQASKRDRGASADTQGDEGAAPEGPKPGSRRAPRPFDPVSREFEHAGKTWSITVDRYWKIDSIEERYKPDLLTWTARVKKEYYDTSMFEPVAGDKVPAAVAKKASEFFENVRALDAGERDLLTPQDAKSLREKTEREAAAKAAEAKQKADEQRRLEREALDRETRDRARQDASAENFVLGQDANDALAGQGSIFDAPQSDAAAQAGAQPAPDGETAALGPEAAAKTPKAKVDGLRKPAVSRIDAFKETLRAIHDGSATVDQYRAGYRAIVDGADEVRAELGKMTKPELQSMFGIMRDGKKDELVNTAYESMLRSFALGKEYGPTSFLMSRGGYENHLKLKAAALGALVDGQTADDLTAFAAERKQEREARAARIADLEASIENPRTLEDFRRFMAYHQRDGKTYAQARMMLTPEQRAAYDDLAAMESRGKRKTATDTERTQVRVAGQIVDGKIIATKHTKKGHDIYVVKLAERVSREDYDTLNAGAKRIGGYYSSFRGAGAVPGFQFTTRDQAEAFVKLAGGDKADAEAAAQERRDAFADDRSQTAAERLTEMADRLDERAEESLGRERKANTERRARFAAGAEAAARADQAMAQTMRNLAVAIASGAAKFLDRVRMKSQVEALQAYVRAAKFEELRAKHENYTDQERHKSEPPTGETADFAEFPSFTAYRSDLASLGRQLLEVDGTKLLGQRLMKVADDVSDAFKAFVKEPGNYYRLSIFTVNGGQRPSFATEDAAERAIARSGHKGKAIAWQVKRGEWTVLMSPSEAMARGIWQGDGDKRITLSNDLGAELVEKIGRANRRGARVSVPWQFETAHERIKALVRIGIETAPELRAALREFIGLRAVPAEPDRVKQLERALVGRRNDGMDFFPTPEVVADEMVAVAGIEPGMRVLEPSAGMGHIAERIRAAGFEPDVGEIGTDKRELLEAKGFNLVARDFMEFDDASHEARGFTFGDVFRAPDGTLGVLRGSGGMGSERVGLDPLDENGEPDARRSRWENFHDLAPVEKRGIGSGYDRILMNPPFSDGRDIQHVRHAYGLLKPGGRLVAVMGESAFTNQNKRATEFREWLESVGGTDEKLPEGTFLDPSLPVNTGANARMVVIDKPTTDQRIGTVAEEPGAEYSAPYETDLFGEPLPQAAGKARAAKPARSGLRGNVQSESSVPADTQAPPGDYYAPTVVGVVTQRKLGAARINSPQEAAQATSYLYESAVERFDGIVTDKDGKPLAVVGGFKGALSQASVYPATLMGEAVRVPGAARIWFSHNHPSGSSTLSRADEFLDGSLADVFHGSGIEPMGLLAVADGEYSFANTKYDIRESAKIDDPSSTATVPVIERRATKRGQKRPELTSPAAAKAAANAYYAANNGPGLMLLDVQHGISAWVPIQPQMTGRLRATGGLNAIYRAVSESNAGAAVIVHGGELDGMVAGSITAAQNIAAALQKLDVRVLDIIDAKTGESAAERGRTIGEGPVYSVAGAPGQTTREALRQRLTDEFGADVIDALEKAGLLMLVERPGPSIPANVAGIHADGRIGMYAANIPAGSTAAAYHEALHATLRRMIGDAAFEALMRRMPTLAMGNRKWFAEAAERIPTNTRPGARAEELAAYSVEQYQLAREAMPAGVRKWVQDLIAAIKVGLGKALQAAGIGLKLRVRLLSDAAVLHKLARDGLRTMAREAGQGAQRSLAPASSVAPQTDSAAFRKWFGDSKVVDARGRPLVSRPALVAARKAASLEGGVNGGASNAKPISDLLIGQPFSLQGLGGLEIPAQRKVLDGVLSLGDDLKILRSVVELIPIDVVDILAGKNLSAEELFRDEAVLKKLLSADRNGSVSTAVDIADALVLAVARMAAKGSAVPSNPFVGSKEVNATAGTGDADVFHVGIVNQTIGNSGAFDATNPDIRYSIAGKQARASWDAPEESRFDSMVYKLQDKQIDTKRVVEAIRKASASLADQANVYLQEELFHGRAAKRTQDFVDLELRPAIVQMQMRGLKVEQLDEYLHARHAEEANELIADRNPDIQDAGSGMSTADARAYLAGLDQTQKRHLEAVAAKIDDIIKGTRDLYAAYGLESADTLNGWAKMFKHYVPLMREDHDGGMGIGQGFSIKGRETKSRTGSANAKVIDILANIALQRERVIVRGEKNRVSNALVGLAEANPNPDFWSVGTPPTVKVYNEKTNQVEDRVDPLFKSRDNVIVAKVLTPSGEVVEKAVMFNESNDRALRMSKSLKNMDTPQLEGLLGNSAKITRYFSAINTQYNPVFGVVNLVRDFQGAILNLSSTPLAGHSKTIAGHTLSALRGVYLDARAARAGKNPSSAWAALWDEFQNEGGQTGYRDLFRTSTDRADAIKRELDPTKWMESGLGKFFTAGGALKVPFAVAQKGATGIFGWLSDYNLAMENAVRLAAYKTGLEQGLSKQHAASIGKNLTVNFNRKGQVGQQAGALYAFFNASMQGSARIAQTLFTMEGSDPSTIRLSKAGKKIVYGGILLGTVQALALAAAGFDDEEPPEFVRERSLIIPTGGKNYITIPMPLGLHILPNLGRIPTEFVLGGFKKPVDHIVKMLALFIDAFNPVGGGASLVQTISPTAIDPIVALAENRDWTGKPIARTAYNPATPGHKLTRDTASATAKVLSEAINFLSGGTDYVKGVFSPTPDQIDFLWGQVTGGVGRELNKADQTVTSLISGESLPPYKVPLIGRFYGNSDSQSSQANSFYSSLNQINEHEAEVNGLRKDGKGLEAARYIRENPESMLISAANAAERRVRELRTMKRDMIARNAPSTQIVAIEHQISARMQAFNELVKRLREKKAA